VDYCKNYAICMPAVLSFLNPTCICLDGYTGTQCETNIDDCASSPCQNGGEKMYVSVYICTQVLNMKPMLMTVLRPLGKMEVMEGSLSYSLYGVYILYGLI
jgi:hypothetical protein